MSMPTLTTDTRVELAVRVASCMVVWMMINAGCPLTPVPVFVFVFVYVFVPGSNTAAVAVRLSLLFPRIGSL